MSKQDVKFGDFGERLKMAMNGAGIGKTALSKLIECSPSAVTNYTRGRVPDLQIVKKIARAVGVDPVWLLFGDPEDGAPVVRQEAVSYRAEGGRYLNAAGPVAAEDWQDWESALLTIHPELGKWCKETAIRPSAFVFECLRTHGAETVRRVNEWREHFEKKIQEADPNAERVARLRDLTNDKKGAKG